MSADITLSGSITGLSTVGGNLGPANFSYALDDATQVVTKEIPVPPGAAGLAVTISGVGTQELFYLKTTEDVDVTVNAEPVKTLKKDGVLVWCGGPDVTALSFDGNGVTEATVYAVFVGN